MHQDKVEKMGFITLGNTERTDRSVLQFCSHIKSKESATINFTLYNNYLYFSTSIPCFLLGIKPVFLAFWKVILCNHSLGLQKFSHRFPLFHISSPFPSSESLFSSYFMSCGKEGSRGIIVTSCSCLVKE